MFASFFLNFSRALLLACSLFTTDKAVSQKLPKQKLRIELGQYFQKDEVKIYLDKKLVYNKTLTTSDAAAVTDAFEIPKPKKEFTLTVEINGEKFEQSSPKKQRELDDKDYSLLVNYNREAEEVELKTKTVIILYD